MMAFIRLLHCINCNEELPDNQSMFNDMLNFSSAVLTTKEFQRRLGMFIAYFEERYARMTNSSTNGNVVKDCFAGIVKHLGCVVCREAAKGEVYYSIRCNK
jgi:predicted nucleic acid-binding Zn ribbon protein